MEGKEQYDDFERVFTYEHLLASARLCKRNVNWKASVQNYTREVHYNTYLVYKELAEGRFKIRSSYEFDLYERGKKRHIRSVHIRERVVQRCLCDYCLIPLVSPSFIYDSCASQEGKGTRFALNRLKRHLSEHYLAHGLDGYVLLFDFKDYFGSIRHDKIMRQFARYVTDERLLAITRLFVEMDGEEGRGLCLGNQVSQVAALMAASPIDHYIKDRMGVKHYVRYMDDGIVIHPDKEFLKTLLADITRIAADYGLEINEKKTRIVKLSDKFTFLKKRISIEESGRIHMRIDRSSVVRMRRKLKKFKGKVESGEMGLCDVETSYQSWRAHALQYEGWHAVQRMDKLYKELFGGTEAIRK